VGRLAVKMGHFFLATRLCLFPYEGMTVTDVIHGAEEAMYRGNTSGMGNYLQADTSVSVPLVVWVGV
jgi:hypothetical protein